MKNIKYKLPPFTKLMFLFLCLVLIGVYSCSTLNDLGSTFNSVNTNPSNISKNHNKWIYSDSELAAMQQMEPVISWAFQKLLMKAVESKDVEQIKKHIEQGANPNHSGEQYYSNTAINRAIKLDCVPCLDVCVLQ